MNVDPYTAAAVVLALAAIGLAGIALFAGKNRLTRNRPDPAAPTVAQLTLASRDNYLNIINDPDIPDTVKTFVGLIAHQNGWCNCEPYDQNGELTTDDLDWLDSQGGAS